MNLLEHFVLQHVQVSLLRAKLQRFSKKDKGSQEARVELNLTPRVMDTEDSQLPVYQISARLTCRGGGDDSGPKFVAQVGYEAIYRQVSGDPIDVAEFSANHPDLTRQLYPLLQQDMRQLLTRLGLEQIHLPFDLAPKVEAPDGATVRLSSSLH